MRGHLGVNPSLKRSSTGVNCFLDTWMFFTSFGGTHIIPLLLGRFFRTGPHWSILFPLCIVLFFFRCRSRNGMSIGISYVIVDGWDRWEGWHLQRSRCQDMDIMHMHGVGTSSLALTINTQDDRGRGFPSSCHLRYDWEEGGDYVFFRYPREGKEGEERLVSFFDSV